MTLKQLRMMDHALTRELVAPEVKQPQFNTFPKCIWDWTCQKKSNCKKFEAKMYTCDTGIAPLKKNDL
jgi:hypothetical protein